MYPARFTIFNNSLNLNPTSCLRDEVLAGFFLLEFLTFKSQPSQCTALI